MMVFTSAVYAEHRRAFCAPRHLERAVRPAREGSSFLPGAAVRCVRFRLAAAGPSGQGVSYHARCLVRLVAADTHRHGRKRDRFPKSPERSAVRAFRGRH